MTERDTLNVLADRIAQGDAASEIVEMLEESGLVVESERLPEGRPRAGYSLADVAAVEGRMDVLDALAEDRTWSDWEGELDFDEQPDTLAGVLLWSAKVAKANLEAVRAIVDALPDDPEARLREGMTRVVPLLHTEMFEEEGPWGIPGAELRDVPAYAHACLAALVQWLEDDHGVAAEWPEELAPYAIGENIDEGEEVGWSGGLPPGITPDQWPRHQRSGLALVHGFTLRLPEPFRAQGPEYVGVSFFHPGESESYGPAADHAARVAEVLAGGALRGDEADQPFWTNLAAHAASSHPKTQIMSDILHHQHALVWHTEASLSGDRCSRPEEEVPAGANGEAMSLVDEKPLRMTRGTEGQLQLGWPLNPIQSGLDEMLEVGFGPTSIQIWDDVGRANFGTGNCQIDLSKALLDWAC